MIILRPAKSDERGTFIELEKSVAHLKTYSAMTTEEEVQEEFKKNTIFFIEREGEVVGSIEYEMKSPDHAYLSGFVVKAEFQNQGIGREALRQLLEKLKGVKVIDLVTHPDNKAALALYSSFGFTVGERIENYFGDGEPRVVLSRTR